jgi:hypothetical protein
VATVTLVAVRRSLSAAAVLAVTLTIAAAASAGPATTNAPAMFSVKVTITDRAISMHPSHAARGSTIIFILTNRGAKTHKFTLGDVQRGPGRTIGFSRTLAPAEQKRIVMYLDIRGPLAYRTATGTAVVARGTFRVT